MAITLPNGRKVTMLRPQLRAYVAADNALRLAKESRDKAFTVAFPVGCEIGWMRGAFVQRGEVVMHGYSDRLKARNLHTGREVWVDGYSIRLFEERDDE